MMLTNRNHVWWACSLECWQSHVPPNAWYPQIPKHIVFALPVLMAKACSSHLVSVQGGSWLHGGNQSKANLPVTRSSLIRSVVMIHLFFTYAFVLPKSHLSSEFPKCNNITWLILHICLGTQINRGWKKSPGTTVETGILCRATIRCKCSVYSIVMNSSSVHIMIATLSETNKASLKQWLSRKLTHIITILIYIPPCWFIYNPGCIDPMSPKATLQICIIAIITFASISNVAIIMCALELFFTFEYTR